MKSETAQRLYEYRKANGYSQEELADKIGVSRQAISKWERCESSPDTDNLIALAELYGITIDELLNGKKETGSPTPEFSKPQPSESNYQYEYRYNSNTPTEESFGAPEREKPNNSWAHAILPICTVITYIILGLSTSRGWACGWLLFFLIPIAETLYSAIKTKNPSAFAFPVLITAWYLTGGMLWGAWHPQWILLLTSPLYYIGCEAYKKSRAAKNVKAGETYYTPSSAEKEPQKSKGSNVVAIIGMIICAVTIVSVAGIVFSFSFLKSFDINRFIPSIAPKTSYNSGSFDYDDNKSYSIGSGEVSASGINSVDIDWMSGSITIQYYDGDTIRFTEPEQSNPNHALRYIAENGALEIKFCKANERNLPSKELLVELPQDMSLDDIDIDNFSATVEIINITASSLDFDTMSGNLTARGSFERIDTDGMSADVNIETSAVPTIINVDTMSGDSKITVPADIPGFTFTPGTMSGSWSLNGFTFRSTNGTHTYGDGSTLIEFDSMSGSFTLEKSKS